MIKQMAALPRSDLFAEGKKFASLAPAIGGFERAIYTMRKEFDEIKWLNMNLEPDKECEKCKVSA
jgi:hypothetical protein